MVEELLGFGSTYASFDALAVVSTKIRETRSLKATLECTTWLEDEKLLARLAFLERLYDYTQGHTALVRHIVTDSAVSPTTVRHVARYMHRLGVTKAKAAVGDVSEALDALRRRLFESEPTALVCGFIEAGVISLDPRLRGHVLGILDHAVQTGFDIRQQSLSALLDNKKVFASIPSNLRSEVKETVSAIVRLHLLVDDPKHITVLLSRNHLSAFSISKVRKSRFVEMMKTSEIDAAVAEVIWTRSRATCIRNQGIWIERLKEKHEVLLTGAFLSQKQGGAVALSEIVANLSILFKDLDQTGDCSECSSVTSPSAYFVDLLHQLSMRAADPSKTSPTLLEELFKRRPDLGNLKLPCANTKVLVPYIDPNSLDASYGIAGGK